MSLADTIDINITKSHSELNLDMISGDTKNLNITINDSNGELTDLTDVSIIWALKGSRTKTENIVEKTLGNGIAVTEKGKFTIRINTIDTQSLSGNYYHACEIIDGFDNVRTVLLGTVNIQQINLSAPPLSISPNMDGGTFLNSDDSIVYDGGDF